MQDRTNLFISFDRLANTHENQLTRALLIVLRCSPLAHQAWLDLVASGRHLRQLPHAAFATQQKRPTIETLNATGEEPVLGISVWLAPEAKASDATVRESDRNQILDGVITYGDELVILFEAKISAITATHQCSLINLHGAPIRFADKPVFLSWQSLVDSFSDLVERDFLTPAERIVLSDFLSLVDQYFPNIGPYSTLARCGRQEFRMKRRLSQVIESATGTATGKTWG